MRGAGKRRHDSPAEPKSSTKRLKLNRLSEGGGCKARNHSDDGRGLPRGRGLVVSDGLFGRQGGEEGEASERTSTPVAADRGQRSARARVKQVKVGGASLKRWGVVSEAACGLLSAAMAAASGLCTEGLQSSQRRSVEHQLQRIACRAKQRAAESSAPVLGRAGYSAVKQRGAQLKEQCLSVVGASEGLAQQLSRRERLILEKQERTEQLCAALQGTPLAEAKAVQLPQLPQARRGRGSVTFDPAQAEVCDAADFAEGLAAALLCEGPAQRVLPT